MTTTDTITTQPQLIAVSRLEKSPLNARRTVGKAGMDELKAAGFLDAVPPSSFSVPNPSDALAADEDPYEGDEEELDLLAEPSEGREDEA